MFKLSKQEKDHRYFCGNKYEKYSIKKLKIGAASVLVGTGFLFGYHVDQVSANEQNAETTAMVTSKDGEELQSADKSKGTAESKQEKAPEVGTETPKSRTKEETVPATSPQVAETKETPETKEVSENKVNSVDKETVNSSTLRANLADLETQLERIRGNKKQASQIQNAEKLVADARQYLEALNTTQKEVDAKAKEISSLTSILKSIKAEETVKENKNTDSRNGKKMQEGTGFREGGAAGTGVGADVVDATSTPAATRDGYTDRATAESLTKQITWLDFGDVANWQNVDNEGGKIYLKEGSIYKKEVISGYVINIKVKSLKPFQATEIYRKRMEAANASEEEKATFNPNATNQHFGEGSGPSRVTADQQDGTWSEVRNNGINTGNKKTAIGAGAYSNIGVQFEISATYKGKNVRPAVIMNDAESANDGENIILTTNGSPWERVIELKKERFVGGTFTPTPYKPINYYNLRHEDYPQVASWNNFAQLSGAMRGGFLTLADGTKFAPKYMTNPDQEMGGLGTGVFGPVTSSGGYSLPVLMTKDATEVGLYILSSGIQSAMMGVIPIDEGDAPESYGKASHTINTVDGVTGGEVKQPYLGSTRPDMDTGTTKDWYGDDNDSDADEGINQLLPDNLKDSEGNIIKANISKKGYYKLNVQAHTGGAEKAYIRSWIDFNNNGKFDEDEGSEIAEITKDGEVSLEFKNKSSRDAGDLLEAGTRVRIATNKAEIENPTGNAFSGEVEDFKTKITHPPKGEKKETIGNIKETQKEEIHFTITEGKKNVYLDGNPPVEIDKTVAPVYFDNKTGQQVTLTSDNTYTVEGEGTYKFIVAENGIDVKVEFTPADGFIGKAHGVSIRRQDTNKTTTDWGVFNPTNDPSITNINSVLDSMDGMYIPEVRVPGEITTSANNAESRNLQGLPQKGQPTFNVESAKEPVKPSAKYPAKLVDPTSNTVTEATTVNALEQGTNKVIGTYTIVPETGEVTFTPNKDFQGVPAPVTVSAEVELSHDKDGNITKKTLTGTYTPTIIPVTPTAEKSETSDVQGKVQTSPIKLDTEETGDDKGKTVNFDKGTQTGPKGERVELDPETLTLLDSTGAEVTSVTTPQGKYELDKANKTISFTPNKDFVGTATPVKVQIKDVNGTKVETTYTPTVTDVTMESVDKTSEAPQGQTQTGKPEFTISSPNVQITGYKLVDPVSKTPVDSTEIEVPEQGTYKIDKTTGQVTFIPKPGYTGTTDGITVQATDENGETKDAKYTPKVTPLTVTPENKTSKNIQGVPQEGTPTFTIPEGVTNASITSRKLVDPSDNTPKGSVTVEGKGTFVIDETGKVTFTPVPSYTGEVPAIEVEATVTVTNEKNEPATITSKATYKPEIVPLELGKTPATSANLQGLEQKGTPTFTGSTVEVNGEQKEVTIKENSYTLVKDGAEVTTTPAYKKGTTDVIGTYTIDPVTGEVTLTPTDKTYTGEVEPAVVQATGSNNVKVQTMYTPTITPVTPTAEKSETSDVQGKVQTSPIKLDTEETGDDKGKTVNFDKGTQTGPKGERVELDPETLTLLDSTGAEVTSVTTPQGKYELDKANKTISFTPNKDFVGTATPVKVQIKDVNGTKVDTTYTPTVIDVTMEGTPKETEAPQGKTQTGKPEFTISSPDVRITGYKLINPTTNTPVDDEEIDVPEQGTYRIDKTTGQVTFIPKAGYTGTADGIKVQATDENGETKDAKYTPKVTPLTVTPENKTSKNIQGLPQEGTPTFTIPEGVTNASITSRKLVDPTDNTPKDSVIVEGKGTFVIDETGKVTFTPVPSYTGDVPAIEVEATVTVTNEKNEPATITSKATYKPEIVPVKPTAESSTTSDVQGKVQTSSIVLDTEETGDDKGKTVNFNKGIEQGPKGERTELNPDTLTLLNEAGEEVTSVTTPQGKYELDKANKTITFTPNKDFAGEATPVKVQIKDVNGTKVETTYTPTVIEVTPTGKDSATTGPQGIAQTSPIVFNQKDESDNTTVNFETGHERVELKQDTLTLVNGNGEKVTTITVPEVGKYELKDGAITFTPVKTFTGTADGVTVQVEDENGKVVTKKYVPTVTPVTPEGTPAETTGLQGIKQEGTPTFKPGNPNVPIDEEVAPTLEGANPEGKVVVPGEGTYTVDKDGKVTFTPEPQFTGTAKGVTVKRVDKNGTPVTATYTPTVTPVTPEGTPAETTGLQGIKQEGTPTFKPGNPNVPINEEVAPTLEGANPEGKVVVPGEGTYTVDKDGKVTFTPEPQFTGTAKGVTVKRVDKNGTPVTATYTPTVTPVTPEGTPAETTGLQGIKQEGTPTFKPGNPNVPINEEVAPTLEGANPEGKVVVPGEGTYTVDKDGKVTFTPEPQFTGTAKGVTVKRVDKNGTPVTAKYTPTVTPVTPTGENAETEGPKAQPQTSPIVFDKKDQDNSTVNFNKGHENVALDPTTTTLVGKDGKPTTEVKIPGEGTYTLANNVITFTPEKDFAGKATGVTVQVKDANGTKVEKTYTPTVHPVTTFVDEAGNPITVDKNNTPVVPEEDGTQPKKDIPGYRFVETKKLPNGDTEHVYEKVKTSFKDKEGNEISGNPSEDGEQPKKAIPGYRFVETKKLPNGDTEHVYEKVTTPTPSVEKPRIIARDTEGNIIPGFEFDML
ncbi:GEVED domain-containing protein, partial [uncultured Streptococcus sp.]|uniref:GEVED domain-containing protein n=1 Tax=uncultured Streptococcus sp. TaxID=83427 RepID=UPI003211B8D6